MKLRRIDGAVEAAINRNGSPLPSKLPAHLVFPLNTSDTLKKWNTHQSGDGYLLTGDDRTHD
jgi:hypothetical protein